MKTLLLMWTSADAAGGDQSDIDAWAAFDAQVREAGALIDGAALEPAASSAKVVTPDLAARGASTVEDGPVTGGSEQVEGFYLLDCPNVDAALEWARRMPTYGRVEVRPLIDYDLGRDTK